MHTDNAHQCGPPPFGVDGSDKPWLDAHIIICLNVHPLHRPRLFRVSGASITGKAPSMAINDTVVDTIIVVIDDNGNVVDEIVGVMM